MNINLMQNINGFFNLTTRDVENEPIECLQTASVYKNVK